MYVVVVVVCGCVYTGIYEDVRDECTRYGRVVSLEIPRPTPNMSVSGVGKVK